MALIFQQKFPLLILKWNPCILLYWISSYFCFSHPQDISSLCMIPQTFSLCHQQISTAFVLEWLITILNMLILKKWLMASIILEKNWSSNPPPAKYIISFITCIFAFYWADSLHIFQLIHIWSLMGYHIYSDILWGFWRVEQDRNTP